MCLLKHSVPRWTIVAVVAAAIYVLAFQAHASRSVPEGGFASSRFWPWASKDSVASFLPDNAAQAGQSLLRAGRPVAAARLFEEAWQQSAVPNWSRGRIAWYLALCAAQRKDADQADRWFAEARRLGMPELEEGSEEVWASLSFSAAPRPQAKIHFVAYQAPDATKTVSLEDVVARVREAEQQFDSKKLATRVRLATWLLLFGEMTATQPDRNLCSSSLDAIERGSLLLGELSKDLDADVQLAAELEKDPLLAIRFDTAVVRQAVTRERAELAREQERARLNQLRQLCLAYKHSLEVLSAAQTSFLLGDNEDLRQLHRRSLDQLAAAEKIVAGREDVFLFDDEPMLNGQAEFKQGAVNVEPISKQVISQLKALHALSALRQAETVDANEAEALLKEALDWSRAALSGEDALADLPAGFDQENLLAKYVSAAVADRRGRQLAVSDDKAARQSAQAEFTAAREALQAVTKALPDQPQPPQAGLLRVQAQSLAGRLQDAAVVSALAEKQIAAGDGGAAIAELGDGALRLSSVDLAVEQLELRRRQGEPLSNLLAAAEQYRRAELLPESHPRVALLLAQLQLEQLTASLAKKGMPAAGTADFAAAGESLMQAKQSLDAALKDVKDGDLKAQIQAQAALLLAYRLSLESNLAPGHVQVQESFRLAQDAVGHLEPRVNDAALSDRQRNRLRQSLVAGRLAIGYLGLAALPAYRDDALMSLSAAFDNAAEGSLSTEFGLLGTPLLLAVTRRDPNGLSRAVIEERERRQLMTRFVEAALVLELGEPAAAAAQMKQALSQESTEGAGQQAANLSRNADGLESAGTLRTTVAAFQVLGAVRAGQSREALLAALQMIKPSPEDLSARLAGLSEVKIRGLASQLESPAAATALALAAEAYAGGLPLETDSSERATALTLAREAAGRSETLLSTSRLAQRYPHLAALNNSALKRLRNPDHYVGLANDALAKGDNDRCRQHCREGLSRHPAEQRLWALLIRTQIAHAQSEGASPESLQSLTALVQQAFERGSLSQFDQHYFRGILQDLRQQKTEALASFQAAGNSAADARERVKALSQSALLKARMELDSGSR
jgi:hypothetical protein